MNRDEIIEFEPVVAEPGEIKQLLSDEKYMPIIDQMYRGLCMVNLNEIFPSIPDPIYGGSRKSLDEPSPLVYFETHVSS